MCINRKIEYYIHSEALDGFYPEMPNQYDTAEGILLQFADNIQYVDGKPFQQTEAIVEDAETHEVKVIDYHLLKSFTK